MDSRNLTLCVVLIGFCHWAYGRQGRVIFLNTDNSIDIALQVIVPFGVALPMVKKEEGRGARHSRIENRTHEYEDPEFGVQLARLDYYFSILEVDNEMCRRKLICDFAKNPHDFYPIGDIFLKQFGLKKESENERYNEYLRAAENGFSLGSTNGNGSINGDGSNNGARNTSCLEFYPSCHLYTDDLLDMDAINFWKFLRSIFRFRFTE